MTNINRDAQLSTISNAAYLDTPPLKITIGYRGTDGRGDLSADFTFGIGGWSQQFTDAAKFTAAG